MLVSFVSLGASCSSGGGKPGEADLGSSDGDVFAEVGSLSDIDDTGNDGSAQDKCDLLEQNCPEGEGCFHTTVGIRCIVAGSSDVGEECYYTNDCSPGLVCVDLAAGSVCATLCSLDSDHAKACSAICDETFGKLADIEGLGFCKENQPVVPCDILAQDCPEGQGCYLSNDGVSCGDTAAGLGPYEQCEYANDCVPGLVCVNGECHQVCDPESPRCPEDHPVCHEPPGLENAGICIIPPG